MSGELVGLAEIAATYGLKSTQAANRWAGHPEFPTPREELKQGRVWDAKEVDAWVGKHRPDVARKRRKQRR
jgi:hypothetical protein